MRREAVVAKGGPLLLAVSRVVFLLPDPTERQLAQVTPGPGVQPRQEPGEVKVQGSKRRRS